MSSQVTLLDLLDNQATEAEIINSKIFRDTLLSNEKINDYVLVEGDPLLEDNNIHSAAAADIGGKGGQGALVSVNNDKKLSTRTSQTIPYRQGKALTPLSLLVSRSDPSKSSDAPYKLIHNNLNDDNFTKQVQHRKLEDIPDHLIELELDEDGEPIIAGGKIGVSDNFDADVDGGSGTKKQLVGSVTVNFSSGGGSDSGEGKTNSESGPNDNVVTIQTQRLANDTGYDLINFLEERRRLDPYTKKNMLSSTTALNTNINAATNVTNLPQIATATATTVVGPLGASPTATTSNMAQSQSWGNKSKRLEPPDSKGQKGIFTSFCEYQNCIEALISRPSCDINKGVPPPLVYASYFGNEYLVRLLLENGANPNVCDNLGQTALFFAENEHMVKLLLRYGADVTQKNLLGQTALHILSFNGLNESVSALLNEGNPDLILNVRDNAGRSALHCAEHHYKTSVQNKSNKRSSYLSGGNDDTNPTLLVELLEKGANPLSRTNKGVALAPTTISDALSYVQMNKDKFSANILECIEMNILEHMAALKVQSIAKGKMTRRIIEQEKSKMKIENEKRAQRRRKEKELEDKKKREEDLMRRMREAQEGKFTQKPGLSGATGMNLPATLRSMKTGDSFRSIGSGGGSGRPMYAPPKFVPFNFSITIRKSVEQPDKNSLGLVFFNGHDHFIRNYPGIHPQFAPRTLIVKQILPGGLLDSYNRDYESSDSPELILREQDRITNVSGDGSIEGMKKTLSRFRLDNDMREIVISITRYPSEFSVKIDRSGALKKLGITFDAKLSDKCIRILHVDGCSKPTILPQQQIAVMRGKVQNSNASAINIDQNNNSANNSPSKTDADKYQIKKPQQGFRKGTGSQQFRDRFPARSNSKDQPRGSVLVSQGQLPSSANNSPEKGPDAKKKGNNQSQSGAATPNILGPTKTSSASTLKGKLFQDSANQYELTGYAPTGCFMRHNMEASMNGRHFELVSGRNMIILSINGVSGDAEKMAVLLRDVQGTSILDMVVKRSTGSYRRQNLASSLFSPAVVLKESVESKERRKYEWEKEQKEKMKKKNKGEAISAQDNILQNDNILPPVTPKTGKWLGVQGFSDDLKGPSASNSATMNLINPNQPNMNDRNLLMIKNTVLASKMLTPIYKKCIISDLGPGIPPLISSNQEKLDLRFLVMPKERMKKQQFYERAIQPQELLLFRSHIPDQVILKIYLSKTYEERRLGFLFFDGDKRFRQVNKALNDVAAPHSLVIKALSPGKLLDSYNMRQIDRSTRAQIGDRVIDVNGVSGDFDRMRLSLQREDEVAMSVLKYQEFFPFFIKKCAPEGGLSNSSDIGLQLTRVEYNCSELRIMKISGAASRVNRLMVETYNRHDLVIEPYMRVVGVKRLGKCLLAHNIPLLNQTGKNTKNIVQDGSAIKKKPVKDDDEDEIDWTKEKVEVNGKEIMITDINNRDNSTGNNNSSNSKSALKSPNLLDVNNNSNKGQISFGHVLSMGGSVMNSTNEEIKRATAHVPELSDVSGNEDNNQSGSPNSNSWNKNTGAKGSEATANVNNNDSNTDIFPDVVGYDPKYRVKDAVLTTKQAKGGLTQVKVALDGKTTGQSALEMELAQVQEGEWVKLLIRRAERLRISKKKLKKGVQSMKFIGGMQKKVFGNIGGGENQNQKKEEPEQQLQKDNHTNQDIDNDDHKRDTTVTAAASVTPPLVEEENAEVQLVVPSSINNVVSQNQIVTDQPTVTDPNIGTLKQKSEEPISPPSPINKSASSVSANASMKAPQVAPPPRANDDGNSSKSGSSPRSPRSGSRSDGSRSRSGGSRSPRSGGSRSGSRSRSDSRSGSRSRSRSGSSRSRTPSDSSRSPKDSSGKNKK